MRHIALTLTLVIAACVTETEDLPASDHEELSDFDVEPADGKADGVPAAFNRHDVMGNDVFLDDGKLDAADVQAFFDSSPYGTTSWLATYSVNGVSAAQMLVTAARAHGISPIVMLGRMQVESSLVSKTVMPSQSRIDHLMGCGCPDGRACSSAYRGFANQLDCAAEVLREGYDLSVDGTGEWRVGRAKRTLDPLSVTPVNHATAALYWYTPWVLQGRGGNWLIWNVTKKFVRHATDEGLLEN